MAADYSQGVARYLAFFPRSVADAEPLCAAVRELAPEPLRIVDLGAGLGASSMALAAQGHQLIAIEPDAEMATVFATRLAAAPELQGRLALLPESASLAGGATDLVLCQSVLHLLPDDGEQQLQLLREAARLLRPGGQLWLELPIASPQRQALPWALIGERQLGEMRLLHHREMHADGELDWVTQWRFELWQGERLLSQLERVFRWRPMAPERLRGLGEAVGLRWLGLGGSWSLAADGGLPGYGYARLARP